jgi:hypothetical protein
VPDVFYGFHTYRDEINYLKLWVHSRVLWMDAHMDALPTAVDSQETGTVRSFVLGQNYPNPFNQATVIPITLGESAPVRCVVYDALGNRVWEADRRDLPAGRNGIVWNGMDSRGRSLASGVYACAVQIGKEKKTIKLVLLK